MLAVVTDSGILALRMDRWVRRCLGVRACHASVQPLAWHARATSRVGALWRSRAVGIPLNGFQNCFSPIFRTKLHLRV
jgi:hypothetical protein